MIEIRINGELMKTVPTTARIETTQKIQRAVMVDGHEVAALKPEDAVQIIGGVPTPPPPPLPSQGTEIFKWLPGDITPSAWSEYLHDLPKNAAQRPHGKNKIRCPLAKGRRILAAENYEVPVLESNGEFVAERFNDPQNKHSMLWPWGAGEAQDDFYLRAERDLSFDFSVTVETTKFSESQYKDKEQIGWMLIFQLWQNQLKLPGWRGSGDVPIQLIWRMAEGRFRMQARVAGSSDKNPTDFTYSTYVGIDAFEFDKKMRFQIDLCLDWQAKKSYYKLRCNGEEVFEIPRGTKPIGLNQKGSKKMGSAVPAWGCYTSGSALPGPRVRMHDMTIHDYTDVSS